MKLFILSFSLLFSFTSLACQCVPGISPMSPSEAVVDYVENYYGEKVTRQDFEVVRYYPSAMEKLFIMMDEYEGYYSSCVYKVAGSLAYSCTSSFKGDYVVKLPGQDCEIKLKVRTTRKSSKVKEVASTCL